MVTRASGRGSRCCWVCVGLPFPPSISASAPSRLAVLPPAPRTDTRMSAVAPPPANRWKFTAKRRGLMEAELPANLLFFSLTDPKLSSDDPPQIYCCHLGKALSPGLLALRARALVPAFRCPCTPRLPHRCPPPFTTRPCRAPCTVPSATSGRLLRPFSLPGGLRPLCPLPSPRLA